MKCIYIIYYILLFVFAFLFQSICLHITTKIYIDEMFTLYQLNETYNQGKLIDIVGSNIKNNITIPILVLDYIGFIPLFAFICLTIVSESSNNKSIKIFFKTMINGSILAILKGLLDIVTIIPDSSGISVCKSRLTTEQYNYLHQLNFKDDFFQSLQEILKLDFFGFHGKRVRYCSDMLLSGHTYFIVLFCLGIYEIIINAFRFNRYQLWIIRLLFFMYTFIGVCLIEIDRFHYTVDVLLAIVLTILLWNCKSIEQFALNRSYEYYNINYDIENQYHNCVLKSESLNE